MQMALTAIQMQNVCTGIPVINGKAKSEFECGMWRRKRVRERKKNVNYTS